MTMTTEECRAALKEAEAAYHQLQLGGMPRVVVDQNGQRVEFTAGNVARLMGYIQTLKSMCPCEVLGGNVSVAGPARFIF